MCGSYIGDESYRRYISLSFTPSFVIVGSTYYPYNTTLALRNVVRTNDRVRIYDGGFTVVYSSNDSGAALNQNGVADVYVAFK